MFRDLEGSLFQGRFNSWHRPLIWRSCLYIQLAWLTHYIKSWKKETSISLIVGSTLSLPVHTIYLWDLFDILQIFWQGSLFFFSGVNVRLYVPFSLLLAPHMHILWLNPYISHTVDEADWVLRKVLWMVNGICKGSVWSCLHYCCIICDSIKKNI